jgi:5-hydroxyisourate hydrolase
MSPITTHVLDTALGRPAVGLDVTLDRLETDGRFTRLAERFTNEQGRIADFLAPGSLEPDRTYRLTFDTGPYFAASGRPMFYPYVKVIFTVLDAREHYHVPLLLSPFGYSTYRGT